MKLSIRKFLLLNLFLAITATMAIMGIGNYYFNQIEIEHEQDHLLSQAAFAFQALIDNNLDNKKIANIQSHLNNIPEQIKGLIEISPHLKNKLDETDRYQFQLLDKNDKLILYSPNAPRIPVASKHQGFSNENIKGETWRVFTTHDYEQNLTFVVAEHFKKRYSLARRIFADDLYLMLLVYPLSGLLIWIIIGRGLKSIQRVTEEVAQRAADRLEPVDIENVPSEIKPLIDELSKLFLRLKQAFEREQRFGGDAAHELRTPLAALKTQAQVALKSTNMEERQMHLQQVLTGVDRCTHIIQQLLTLSRMNPEAVNLENPIKVDVSKSAAEVIAQIAPAAIDKKIDIELITQGANFDIMGNPTALHALVRNLVDNAVRYTPENGQVKVFIIQTDNLLTIKVIDNGPGIPPELRTRVFERFFRILGTNTQGSGLGLAIVLQITKLHQGNVTLGIPESGVGLEVEVSIPINMN